MLETKGKFGDYKIIEEIGQGGMGKVYKAYHPHLDKTVAIKVMLHVESNSQKQRDRFFSEAKNTARLTHPNIVNIHDVIMGELDYIVMDFIEGSSLETLLKKTKFSPRKALEIIRDTALAIDYAHKNDIVHRDLKPANIIIETQSKRPIVMDFGISKNIKKQKGLTQTGELLGTLQYMAPEQAEGNLRSISPATDVYSLGAILYEMITGHKIVEGNTQYNLIHNIVNQEVIPPRNINPYIAKDIETICMKALEKEPKRRYQTAQAFAEDIERFLNGEIISARPANLLYRLGKNIQRYKLPIASICTSLLLLFAILLAMRIK